MNRNGQCEQSARNYKGTTVRNFHATTLRERLSCKPATQYNRVVSSTLIPVGYGEDIEIETRHTIRMASPQAHAREVRAYANQTCVPVSYQKARTAIYQKQPDVCAIIKVLRSNASAKKKAAANQQLDGLIRGFYASRINKRIMDAYKAGKLSPLDVFRRARIIGRI